MIKVKEAREEWLTQSLAIWEQLTEDRVRRYIEEYYKIERGSVLRHIAPLWELRGLRDLFIDGNLNGLKQNYYVACKLLMASQKEVELGGDVFATYTPFLNGLLSDSPEIYEWLAQAELKNKDYVKGPHFLFHQFQLVLRGNDEALRETIALVANKGGNRDKALAREGQDFFSLLLKQDNTGLQTKIEGQAKIKPAQELHGQFLAGFAVIHAKLCWYRGVEVQIHNPLVPVSLLAVQPLDAYHVEYDFLRPDWAPPPLGFLTRVKQLFS